MTQQEFWDLAERYYFLPWIFLQTGQYENKLPKLALNPHEWDLSLSKFNFQQVSFKFFSLDTLNLSSACTQRVASVDKEETIDNVERQIWYDIYYHLDKNQISPDVEEVNEKPFIRRKEVLQEPTIGAALAELGYKSRGGVTEKFIIDAVVELIIDTKSTLRPGMTVIDAAMERLHEAFEGKKDEQWKAPTSYRSERIFNIYLPPDKLYEIANPT